MTITSEPQTSVEPDGAQAGAIADVKRYASAYQDMAAFLRIAPEIAARTSNDGTGRFVAPVMWADDPIAEIVYAIQRANEAGIPVVEYMSDQFGGVRIQFGPIYLQVYADAHQVVSSVVVGTVPDVQRSLVVDLDGNPRKDAEQPSEVTA